MTDTPRRPRSPPPCPRTIREVANSGKTMCQENLRHLAKQRRATHLFLGAIRSVMRDNNYKPDSDSPEYRCHLVTYYSEMAWSGELHEQSDVQAQMALLASIQHMSLATEDAGRRPPAFLVLVRAALEASASAHFLSSPDIGSVAERARRGLNEMLSACYYQWRALDQYGQSDDAAVKLELMNEWLDRVSSYPELGPVTRAHERRRPNAPYVGDQKPTISVNRRLVPVRRRSTIRPVAVCSCQCTFSHRSARLRHSWSASTAPRRNANRKSRGPAER